MLLTRAYHEDRGEHRTKVLTPDTAHGTNPATVTMAGYEVVKVGTDERGGVDVDDLRAKADEDVACLMLTNPNTLGLFDENIEEIAKIVHGVGATLYYDGANLNAVMGRTRPGDMGFDIVHFNLHKTFTQPHGGGGPGAGPIAVSDRIEPYLPRPQVVRREADNGHGPSFDLDYDRPKSIGRLRGFQGNYGVFVRSYAYILLARRRRPAGGVGDRGAERELPARAAQGGGRRRVPAGRLRPRLHARVRALGRADEEATSGSRRSTSPSACSTTASTRRRSTSRCSSTRRCWSSRPRRRRRRRSTPSPTRSPRSCARAPRIRRSRATRRTRRRCAGSTRPAPPSARSSASRSRLARVRLGLALLVAFLLAASPAAADSIVLVRDGDVWISTPDGTTERS